MLALKKDIFLPHLSLICKLEFLKIKTSLIHFVINYKLILKANQMAYQEVQNLYKNSRSA
ncbi:hypothetical protein DB42_CO00250 [Neochlamydia sp. EPS4]|nr:hypothetical protein DB42_CO00250 [Neochlamydia sp. EPS4]